MAKVKGGSKKSASRSKSGGGAARAGAVRARSGGGVGDGGSTNQKIVIGAAVAAALVIGGVVLLSGNKTEVRTTVGADAGADAGDEPVLDSKLAAAMAAASDAGAAASPTAAAKAADAPPERGVFELGLAEKAHPAGTPPVARVIEAGGDPKSKFTAASPAAGVTKVSAEVSLGLGGQGALPNILFGLSVGGAATAAEDEQAPAPADFTAKLSSAALAEKQPGQVRQEVGDLIAKLKGSVLTFSRTPSGGAFDPKVALAKGAEPQLESVVRALSEAVSLMTPVFPDAPVGVGGFWMVTDRADSLGIDVVRYRVFKVEKVDADGATLSIDIRQYASRDKPPVIPGAPPDANFSVDLFESTGKGTVRVTSTSVVPTGELNHKMQVILKPGNAPPQQQGRPSGIPLTTELIAKITG